MRFIVNVSVYFGVILAIGIILLLFYNKEFLRQLLVKFRGRTDEVMMRDAATPEGAKDYYNAAIRKKEDSLAQITASYVALLGRLETAKKQEYDLRKKKKSLVDTIDGFVENGKDDEAIALIKQRDDIEGRLEQVKQLISNLEDSIKQQLEMKSVAEEELSSLKREKDNTVFQMEIDQQIMDAAASMNGVISTDETDRMLERVRDGARKKSEMASGSKVAYDTSAVATERRMKKEASDLSAKKELERIKRNKGIE